MTSVPGPAQCGMRKPRTRVIGTGHSPATSARNSSPPIAEPPMAATTTAPGSAMSTPAAAPTRSP